VLSETERFKFISQTCCADIDLEKLSFERTMNSSYKTSIKNVEFRTVGFLFEGVEALSLTDASQLFTTISRTPFVPQSEEEKNHHFDEIFNIVCAGLKKRILHVGSKTAIIGISGGLDSTLALLFLNQVFNDLGYPVSNILGISMPGFGTSKRTKNNAKDLLKFLGNSYKEISIVPAVNQHFKDIGHDPKDFDITYENSQARERTQILMDVANKNGGLLIGTGDLSEMALGWCTFNGDHMSMYHVNSGIPKTLVRFLVTWISNKYYESQSKVNVVLNDIVNTPITPELLPLGKDQELVQKTEDVIGSYDLIDFILFNFLRNGYSPSKIKFLAETAFKEEFSSNYLKKYINLFFKRFFQNQFKRSSTPDGPKVGSVALSPRADWRMPSDASYEVWRL
jgi:NAD+ synthase (glutamine-hydrolysing)